MRRSQQQSPGDISTTQRAQTDARLCRRGGGPSGGGQTQSQPGSLCHTLLAAGRLPRKGQAAELLEITQAASKTSGRQGLLKHTQQQPPKKILRN